MRTTVKLAVTLLAGVMLAGCSETSFQDVFGVGKYSPDESQVSQGQSLSTPPDLQLRPPGDGEQPVQQAYQPPPQQPQPYQPPAQDLLDQPQQPVYQPQQTYQAPQQQAYQQPASQAPQPVNQQPQQLQPPAADDVYARYGVSRTKPDGTEKTQAELNEEMRKKKLEIEQAKNPNYGTIFNMGSIWSDG